MPLILEKFLAQKISPACDEGRQADQIERSGPSIALNYSEAQAASSRAHFIAIIETAEREARETQAALEIIIDQQYIKPKRLEDLYTESSEIVAILTTIAKRAKENQYNKKKKRDKRFRKTED